MAEGSAPVEDGHVATLIEWRAPRMTPKEAREVARFTLRMLELVPGFVGARFFGDFEHGVHYYLLTWEDREALEAYMVSQPMLRARDAAARFVEGKPDRRIMADYTPRGEASA